MGILLVGAEHDAGFCGCDSGDGDDPEPKKPRKGSGSVENYRFGGGS